MSLTMTVLVVVAYLQRMKRRVNRAAQTHQLSFKAMFEVFA